jgi:branched-chain amino acid aminotransferase
MITGKILGNRYVINNNAADVSGFVPDMSADIYYEVIRLIDGKVLFLNEHLDRLQHSISGSGIDYPGNHRIVNSLALLVNENSFSEGNIRISLQRSNGDKTVLQCYFIPYFYPDSSMYEQGVKLLIYPHVRPNPGVKKWDDQFRNSVSAFILENKVYEVALKNLQNKITEGSRSNIFFIDRTGRLITPPARDILKGITRKHILEIAVKEGFQIQENSITTDALDSMVSVFISGTSPKVLPVKQIGDSCFDVNHPVLRTLMEKFGLLMQANLKGL